MSKQETFTVMHDKGEFVGGKNIRPYETFKSVMTDELQEKVDKGFLFLGSGSKPKSSSKKKAIRRK